MTLAAKKQLEHIGETKPIADHDHDLVHTLSDRVDAVWRYDQYIANAEGKPELQSFWRDLKERDEKTVAELRERIAAEVADSCF